MVALNVDLPHGCADCKFGRSYGLVGDRYCTILRDYFTDNLNPPFLERPDQCPLEPMPEEVTVKNCEGRKMSNADRIRSMTDEELMRLLLRVRVWGRPWCDDKPCNKRFCSDCITEWLKKEVSE